MIFKQTKFLSSSDFTRLNGTALMEKMLRNLWTISYDDFEKLMKTTKFDRSISNLTNFIDYLDQNATGVFSVGSESGQIKVYLESALDTRLLQDL